MQRARKSPLIKACYVLLLGSLLVAPVSAAPVDMPAYSAEKLSPNIALDSYVYVYLEKLSGLGYIPELLPGTKPYTRMQAARWLLTMDADKLASEHTPAFVRSMVRKLNEEFAAELATLRDSYPSDTFALREASVEVAHYDGDTLANLHTKSTYQPLNINNNGYRYGDGLNGSMRLRMEGKIGSAVLASISPRLDLRDGEDADGDLESAYIKAALGRWEFQAGKDSMWWGQGIRGTRALTNNAEPVVGLKISTLEPMKARGLFKPLGQVGVTAFYGQMTEDRTDVQDPGLFAIRTDIQPSKNFTIGTTMTSIVGGDGRGLGWDDWWDFIRGENAHSNDKWNSMAGLDFRWRIPHANGSQLYGEIYGEDQARALGFIPTPSKTSELVGLYIPRLTAGGDWDAALEYARTGPDWYWHGVYDEGYVNDGNIIGDAMGWNARRYYARLTHYSHSANPVSLHYERLTQGTSLSAPQRIDSVWASQLFFLERDAYLEAAAGVAFVKNPGYGAGDDERNYLLKLTYTKKY